jgi:inorganic pyrophosphatase
MTTDLFNPWHNVSIGNQQPHVVQAIIEIPKGKRTKYELDKTTGGLRLDRVLYSATYYPANYGFIPQTLGEDHDPLDILVLCQESIEPLCIVRAKVIGVMRMTDHDEADDKIIAVAADDASVSYLNNINELAPHFQAELKEFFQEYKKLENKKVVVEEFQNATMAKQIIAKSINDYKTQFKL